MSGGRPRKVVPRYIAASIVHWTDEELLCLATALHKYGFADTNQIAKHIGTKSESDVRAYLTYNVRKATRKLTGFRRSQPADFLRWSNARKWQRVASHQIMRLFRRDDFSSLLMPNICRKFYEDAEEPSSSQVINLKAIYKYVLECVSGEVPCDLPPKESALVLLLFQEIREMKDKLNFTEEIKFIQKFKKAKTFVPFKLKDEFRKSGNIAPPSNTADVLALPEEIYSLLSLHRKFVQSFNPLTVPLWNIFSEQEQLQSLENSSTSTSHPMQQ